MTLKLKKKIALTILKLKKFGPKLWSPRI